MFDIDVRQWGYLAVFLGSMIEGESILLTASALAAAGYLSIYKIAFLAFIATLFADQGLFFLGYFYGDRVLSVIKRKFPSFEPYLEKGFSFLHRFQTTYILVFRFIYGIRIISPIIIGSQKLSIRKFTFLNLIAALIWTVLSCSLGYFLGDVVTWLVKEYGKIIVFSILSLFIAGFLVYKLFKGKFLKKEGDK
jgi:membrane protein DedA with SNARE-associated domain